jgi:hypothetical protein
MVTPAALQIRWTARCRLVVERGFLGPGRSCANRGSVGSLPAHSAAKWPRSASGILRRRLPAWVLAPEIISSNAYHSEACRRQHGPTKKAEQDHQLWIKTAEFVLPSQLRNLDPYASVQAVLEGHQIRWFPPPIVRANSPIQHRSLRGASGAIPRSVPSRTLRHSARTPVRAILQTAHLYVQPDHAVVYGNAKD